MKMTRQLPLIVVVGASACGKSKLAIELASRFGGEILSADSMQVYRGLDIVTNKVTQEEQAKVKHHMMNFLEPTQNYSVVDFRQKSLDILTSLQTKNTLPIVVGGTNYYIESLLWKSFLLGQTTEPNKRNLDDNVKAPQEDAQTKQCTTLMDMEAKMLEDLPRELIHTEEDLLDKDKFFKKTIYPTSFKNVDSEKLWAILEQVDPETAHLCHPHSRRAIIRFLQIYQQKGRKYSEILKDVNKSSCDGKSSLGGPLRFEKTCVFWIHCEYDILDKALDDRVDEMLSRGLLAELEDFHKSYNKQRVADNEKPDYTKGIFQTIGFKEFHKYLIMDPEAKVSDEGQRVLKQSIEDMKISTRQYVRKQLKWIRGRILRSDIRDTPDVFKLTTTLEEGKWQEQIRDPAFKIVEILLDGQSLNENLLALKQKPIQPGPIYGPGKHYCEPCDRILIGSTHIEEHLKSKKHHRKVTKFNRKKRRIEDRDTSVDRTEKQECETSSG